MPGYAVKKIDDMEGIYLGGFKLARAEMGITSFGMQVIDIPAGYGDYPEHDHSEDGQEEVYLALRGSGEIEIDGERHPLDPNTMVRVSSGTKRKIWPGDDGIRRAGDRRRSPASRTRCRSSRSSELPTRWLQADQLSTASSAASDAPEALLGLEHGRGLGADPPPIGRDPAARARSLPGPRRRARSTPRRPLGRQRALVVADLREKARVHEPEVAAAGSPALDHLIEEPRAPPPVLRLLRPARRPRRRNGEARAAPGSHPAPARACLARSGRSRRARRRSARLSAASGSDA